MLYDLFEIFALPGCYAAYVVVNDVSRISIGPIFRGQAVWAF
jgi:hypothetical protein